MKLRCILRAAKASLLSAGLGAAVIGSGAMHASAQVDLYPHVDFDAVTAPGADRDTAAGDLDGDGDLDLAVACAEFYGSVRIWLNDGTGGMTPTSAYQVGGRGTPAFGIALGDLDSDGDLDFAVAVGNRVRIFLNDGDATFANHSWVDPVYDAQNVAIGDLDQDGDPDLVGASWNFRIYVALNDGRAFFPSSVDYSTNDGRPRSVQLGDVDQDGDLDAVTANDAGNTGFSVFRNRGDGTFSPVENYVAGGNPRSVALGDLDGDGDLDAAVANPATITGTPGISLFQNRGHGRFEDAVNHDTRSRPMGVTAADLDADGDLDLAVADNWSGAGMSDNLGRSRLAVLINDGAGGFADQQNFAVGPSEAVAGGPWSVVAADLDGDGDPDVLTRNKTGWTEPLYTFSLLRNRICAAAPLLLALSRHLSDIVLRWPDHCRIGYVVLRSTDPRDFTGAERFSCPLPFLRDPGAATATDDYFYRVE